MIRSVVILLGLGVMACLLLMFFIGVKLPSTSSEKASELTYDGGKPNDEQAGQLVQQLIKRVYQAFNADREAMVYEHLAVAVDESILAELYLQQRRSQLLADDSGARIEVYDVVFERVDIDSRENNGQRLIFDAQWVVFGSVSHSSHEHFRTNRYHALVTIEPLKGAWRISRFELLDELRLGTNDETADYTR